VLTGVFGVLTLLLIATPFGDAVDALIAAIAGGLDSVSTLPTITSREVIPNQGHQLPDGGWKGTFLGLSPAQAWFFRVVVVYGYAFLLLYWLWRGYLTYREQYREADWSPIDDSTNRLRSHPWGKAGLVIVIMFVVMAVWAPALGPVTAEENLYQPYQNEVTYLTDNGEVETALHGTANIQTRSNGDSNVGPLQYDQYGRWAPFGTNSDGKDLFTFLAYGARTSLVIGLLATGLSAGFALALAMVTAYYRGLVDLVAVIGSDSVQSVPFILLVLLLFVVFREANHPLVSLYDGGVLLALILAFTYWPALWRSIRGPSLQIAQAEWIDAAKSFGQRPSATMRKHMAPYVVVYLIIYASLVLGTIVITTAALSFLGLGISPPTPEWGRMIAEGRSFVSTKSWHVATIPGVLIVLVVTGFNAFGDALRDALDVQAEVGSEGGGGGA
jgi:peptide/nickel transport system permease protein